MLNDNKLDNLIGSSLAFASNKALPVGGPILVNFLWKILLTFKLHRLDNTLALVTSQAFQHSSKNTYPGASINLFLVATLSNYF